MQPPGNTELMASMNWVTIEEYMNMVTFHFMKEHL